jgi:NAD dependent epimerase/dehydratase family enzyme
MKVILAGSTGLIGGAILRRAIKEPAITSIVALSRRQLPDDVSKEGKVKTVIMKDFSVYSEDTIAELRGAEACIWFVVPRSHSPTS